MALSDAYRDIKRLSQIVDVLFKYELGFIISSLHLKSLLPISKRTRKESFNQNQSMPRSLRLAMEELGASC